MASTLVVAGLSACPQMAAAQSSRALSNPNILIDYYEPRNPDLAPLYRTLQARRVLERLSEFLASVQWPTKLRLIMKECPAAGTPRPEVFYTKTEGALTICYQWFGFLSKIRPKPAFATQQEVIVGGLVGVVLHEAARAAFDMLAVPVLGSETDAADQLAAFTALQFGEATARAVIKGTWLVWKAYDDERMAQNRPYDFSAGAGLPRQRMNNLLCIAYGGAPGLFKDFVDQGDLLSARADHCETEYRQVRTAFQRTIQPRINEDLAKKALSVTWLSAQDLE